MAEDIVQWPQDADPMANNEVSEGTRIMAANENDEDKMASVTVKQLADKAAERVEYTGIERPEPFDGGGTEGEALLVPDGPSGTNQVADVVSGKWYDFGAGPVQATSSNRWRAYWDGSSWSLVDMGELPEYSATGRIALGQDKAPSGQQAYLDLFDTGQVDLKSLFLNKGKLYPFKNYYGYSSAAIQRFLKAILDVTLYANDTENNKYTISQISVNDPGSGNRIDVTRKPRGGGSTVTYSFRTIGTSEDNSEANDLQLSKLVSGDLVNISLVPKDNSFKLELIADTSEFASSEQVNLYLSPQWDDFSFYESVYKTNDVGEVSTKIGDIEQRMPVKFTNTGVSLDLADQGILKSDGSYFSSSSSRSSSIMDIPDNELYVSGRMAGNSATLVAFYDSEDNFVGTQFESNGTAFNVDRELVVPVEGAARIAFNSYNSGVFLLETVSPDDVASKGQIDEINGEIIGINSSITGLDIRVTDLEQNPSSKTAKAINWQYKVDARRNELQGEYLQKILADPNYQPVTYGVVFNEEDSSPNAVDRLGDLALHNAITGLPLQKLMRSCVYKDGKVQYYLHPDNSNLKEDGSPAVLDGTDGDVMVEIPEIFVKTTSNGSNEAIKELWISPEGIPGYRFYPKFYVAKYYSTVNRDSESLASVCSVNFSKDSGEVYIEDENKYIESDNTGFSLGVQDVYEIDSYASNAATYRGNVNDSSLDGETNPTSQDYARNNLGRPVANINRRTARSMADNAGGVIQQYDAYKVIYYLATVEYATRNLQQPVISELDANGCRQGGLGWGATVYPDYQAYEKYFSPQGGTAVLPNGVTNELGNNSGEVYYRIKNVPVESDGATGGAAVYERWGDVLMPVNCYRGLESYYGQLYDIVDNVDVLVEGIAYPLKRVHYFYQPNPWLTNDTEDKSGYIFEGTFEFNSSIHVIKHLKWGYNGHVFPIGVGSNSPGAYLTFHACASELTQAWNGNIAAKIKYINFGGRAVSKTLVDRLFIVGVIDVDSNRARTSDTVRLQYFGL